MADERIDIAIEKDDDGIYDIRIGPDGDFVTTAGFNTSILMSLFCERRASEDDVPDAAKRRGWVGNETDSVPGFEIGSELWLNEQTRNNTKTKNAQVDAAKESLQWLGDDEYLNDLQVSGILRSEGVELEVRLVRKTGKIDKLYFKLWENTGF